MSDLPIRQLTGRFYPQKSGSGLRFRAAKQFPIFSGFALITVRCAANDESGRATQQHAPDRQLHCGEAAIPLAVVCDAAVRRLSKRRSGFTVASFWTENPLRTA